MRGASARPTSTALSCDGICCRGWASAGVALITPDDLVAVMHEHLDWELDRRGLLFVRYADDGRIYVRSERAGQRVLASISQYVERRLKLKVNRGKSAVGRAMKLPLLGFGFFYNKGEVKVWLDPKALKRAKERLRQLTSRRWGVSMERRIEEINRFTVGWMAYYSLSDAPGAFEQLDKWLRRRLRQVRWKQWKRVRTKRRKREAHRARYPRR